VSEGAHPYTWLHDKEREDRELKSTVGRSREESGGRASRGGDEDHEKQCVMKPTDRLRAHDADLDEQTQREVQREQRSGNVEERDHETYPFNAYPLHRRDYLFRMLHITPPLYRAAVAEVPGGAPACPVVPSYEAL
jgi:hypothetical protein